MTLSETAELLRIPSGELFQLAERRGIPARRIGDAWRFNCATVMDWLNGGWTSAHVVHARDSQRLLSTQELGQVSGGDLVTVQEAATQSDSNGSGADFGGERIGEAPAERTAEDVVLRDQRVLVSPRDVSLNFGQFYAEYDNLILASRNGENVLAAFEQTGLLTTFQARFGVSSESEVFVGASYVNQDSDVILGSQKLASSGNSEFGDVLLGIRHTLSREGLGRPNIIGTLTASIPTGDSSYAIGVGLGFVKSFDPVALFASVNYTHTLSEEFADATRLEPEDRIDASMGYALALNDRLSLSGSLSAVFTGATKFPNAVLRQEDSYSLGFGLTSRISQGVYLEPAVSLGLGGPADGFAFGVSLFTFRP